MKFLDNCFIACKEPVPIHVEMRYSHIYCLGFLAACFHQVVSDSRGQNRVPITPYKILVI